IPRYQREKRYLRKDGTIVDVMLSASLLRDRAGAPLYFISQIEDIRERKRAERSLKESEQRLSLALDSARIGMWDLDLTTDNAVRSVRHDQIFGYSSPVATWGVATFMTHVVPEDRAILERALERARTSGDLDVECRIVWPDQSTHWISGKGRVYLDPTDHPVRMMGTVADITEIKVAEQERSRIEREQRFLADASVVLSSSLDHEQTLASVARLAVQHIADWCAVDLIDEHGRLRRLNIASADPAKSALHDVLQNVPL